MEKKNIVIIGAGFGGVEAARILGRYPELVNVTLISKQESFLYYPALYQLADKKSTVFSLLKVKDMIPNVVNFVVEDIIGLNRENKTVSFLNKPDIKYDTLIVALGSVTEDFGIPGVREYMHQFRTLEDLEKLRGTIIKHIDSNQNDPIIIIGGGPTGVELAAQISMLFKNISFRDDIHPQVMVIEGSPSVVAQLPERAQHFIKKHLLKLKIALYTNTRVTSYNGKVLETTNGEFAARTVIWAAGLAASPLLRDLKTEVDKRGHVIVNEYLEIPSDNSVFVIGDSASTMRSGLAQTAIYDGGFVARSIIHKIMNQKRRIYSAPSVGYAVPVGNNYGVASFGPIIIRGIFGSFFRKIVDIEYLLKRVDIKSVMEIFFKRS